MDDRAAHGQQRRDARGVVGNRREDRPVEIVGAVLLVSPVLIRLEHQAVVLDPFDHFERAGAGLALTDWPDIALFNTSPRLLDALPIKQTTRLEVDVCAIVPARVAGAGLGTDAWIGDLEIASAETIDGSVDDLNFGDLVAFDNIDARAGRRWNSG